MLNQRGTELAYMAFGNCGSDNPAKVRAALKAYEQRDVRGTIPFDAPEDVKTRAWGEHLATAPGHVGTPVSEKWRDETVYDFSGCRHTARYMHNFEAMRFDPDTGKSSVVGIWVVEICQVCGLQVERQCAHAINDWKFDGKLLVCRNCGVDGT